MRSASYTIIFSAVVSIIVGAMLSFVSMALKERQDENRAVDRQMSILRAAQIEAQSKADVSELFKKLIEPMVIDNVGELKTDVSVEEVSEKTPNLLVIFGVKEQKDDKKFKGFIYPVVGNGLWSKLYGYLAVDDLGKEIVGLSFFQQGETPGLGAEIEKQWFLDNFKGKAIFNDDKLVGVRVAKGLAKLDPSFKSESKHLVDGISGATITGDGVTHMLKAEPLKYEAFFKSRRRR